MSALDDAVDNCYGRIPADRRDEAAAELARLRQDRQDLLEALEWALNWTSEFADPLLTTKYYNLFSRMKEENA